MFDNISRDNLVWNNYWNITVGSSAAMTTTALSATIQDGGISIIDVGSTLQYKGTARLTGSYSYVGLTKTAALSASEYLAELYTQNTPTWAIGLSATPGPNPSVKYCWLQKSTAPMSGADVQAEQTGGDMWQVNVDVDAYVESYSTSQPTRNTLTSLVASYKNADSNAQ